MTIFPCQNQYVVWYVVVCGITATEMMGKAYNFGCHLITCHALVEMPAEM